MIPKYRKPTHPGEILLDEFIKPMGITQGELARKMGVQVRTVNALVKQRRDVTAETAVRLGRALNTSSEFWMNLQTTCDLFEANKKLRKVA